MFRSSRSTDGAPGTPSVVAVLAAVWPLLAGCDQGILVSVAGNLSIPDEAASLTIRVTAETGDAFTSQTLCSAGVPSCPPSVLLTDPASGGLPYEFALTPGLLFNSAITVVVDAHDEAGVLTANATATAVFEPSEVTNLFMELERLGCGEDPYELADTGILGAPLNVYGQGAQPLLTLCADDLSDRFNFVVLANHILQIELLGSTPEAMLNANVVCDDGAGNFGTPIGTEVRPERTLPVAATPYTRTCVLTFNWQGEERASTNYGFLASAFAPGECADDLPVVVTMDVAGSATGSVTAPRRILCPGTSESFSVLASTGRILAVDHASGGGGPSITGSLSCDGDVPVSGPLPLFIRTGGPTAAGPGNVVTCALSVQGAIVETEIQIRASEHILTECPDDPAEANDTPATTFSMTAAGWVGASTGGSSPWLTTCSGSNSGDLDYLSFQLADNADIGMLRITLDYPDLFPDGNVDLIVDGPEMGILDGDFHLLELPPTPGRWDLRVLCTPSSPGGICGAAYRVIVTPVGTSF